MSYQDLLFFVLGCYWEGQCVVQVFILRGSFAAFVVTMLLLPSRLQ